MSIVATAAGMAGATAPVQAAQAAARQPDPELTRIEELVTGGRLDDARAALETWTEANLRAPGPHGAAAGLLRGRLARSWPEAEQAYLSTALRYPVTQQAPEALLRIGQGLVTAAIAGDPAARLRAIAYLERLVADYPNSPHRAAGFLWLGRALHAEGRTASACARLQQAPLAAADSTTARLIEIETRNHCGSGAAPTEPVGR